MSREDTRKAIALNCRGACHPVVGTDIHVFSPPSSNRQGAPVVSCSAASIEMLRRLVAMDTTSRNSNLDLIAFIADYLMALGIESRRVHDESRRKANLYATIGPS